MYRYFGSVMTVAFGIGLITRLYLAVALFFITNLFSLYRLSDFSAQMQLDAAADEQTGGHPPWVVN